MPSRPYIDINFKACLGAALFATASATLPAFAQSLDAVPIDPVSLSASPLGTATQPLLADSSFGPSASLMSFEDIERRLRAHPSLSALSFEAEASRERSLSALALPDPVISVQLNNFPLFDPSFTEYLPTNKSVGFRQAFPNGAKRRANSQMRLTEVSQRQEEIEQQFAELRGRTLALLIAREGIEKQYEYALSRAEKYAELTDVIDLEINSGRPLVYRLAQVEVEQSEVATTLSDLDGQTARINAELTELVGVLPETVLPPTFAEIWSGDASAFYKVRVAQTRVDQSQAAVKRAEADFKPDWGVNLTYQQREAGRNAPFGGDDWVSGGVSLSIPLWAGKKQQPDLRAAQAEHSAALARVTAVSRLMKSEWTRWDTRRLNAQENIVILDAKILKLEEQIDAQLITYESGDGDYAPVLDAEIAILNLRAQRIAQTVARDQSITMMNSLLVTQ